MDENLQTTEQKKQELTKVVRAVAGEEQDQQKLSWVEQNITSIQEVVKNGKHNTFMYPASGSDVLRPMVAYDADQLIAIDTNEDVVPQIFNDLTSAGILYEVSEIDAITKQIEINFGGRKRSITIIGSDARVVMNGMNGKTVDILHVYLPTGAETDQNELELYLQKRYGDSWREKQYDPNLQNELVDDPDAPKTNSDTGEYSVVHEGVKNQLSTTNYHIVSEGGFFVFDELRIADDVPDALMKIAGLAEHRITRRHPFTITTSMYPTPEELSQMDKVGYVYQKVRVVPDEVIDCVTEAFSNENYLGYQLMEISRGNFEYIDLENDDIDIAKALSGFVADIRESTSEMASKMRAAGVGEDDIEVFSQEKMEHFRNRLKEVQNTYQNFISTYDSLAERISKHEITQEQAIAELGIIEFFGRHRSKKYPMSIKYLRRGSDHDHLEDIYQKLASVDVDSLFTA